tara:strand:- start:429 stop:1331 length:903 start_codon:yes stop_codon:yes gene_type:complete
MKLGNNDISSFKLGSNDVNKIYLGSTQLDLGGSFLLDGLTGSTGGFSLRKLSSSYVGSAIQVRRDSDDATQNIGFVNNELDTTSLNSFCSGANGFISIWYNQSDTNNNMIQTTSSNQPKIYDSSNGVFINNGKPSIQFENSMYFESTNTTFLNLSDVKSNFGVFKTNVQATQIIMSKGHYSNSQWFSYFTNISKIENAYDGFLSFGSSPNRHNQNLIYSNINNTGTDGLKTYVNNSLEFQNTTTKDLIGTNTYKVNFGRSSRYNTWYLQGNIQELVFFSSDQTSNKIAIETNLNSYYSVY